MKITIAWLTTLLIFSPNVARAADGSRENSLTIRKAAMATAAGLVGVGVGCLAGGLAVATAGITIADIAPKDTWVLGCGAGGAALGVGLGSWAANSVDSSAPDQAQIQGIEADSGPDDSQE